jgi:hypothetical protein
MLVDDDINALNAQFMDLLEDRNPHLRSLSNDPSASSQCSMTC